MPYTCFLCTFLMDTFLSESYLPPGAQRPQKMTIRAHCHVRLASLGPVCALVVTTLLAPLPATAVDGCKVLLCMAGNWRQISQCEPTVRQALHDVARGRGWPQCSTGGNGTANQQVMPDQCPEHYRSVVGKDHNDQDIISCPFTGVVHVAVAGQPWSRAWWSLSGETVIEWLPAAKVALADRPGAMDEQFERERAAWVIAEQARLAALPPAPTPSTGGGL